MTTLSDGFKDYYTEKLWHLIPETYRHYDTDGTLRALVEIIGAHAAVARRGVDRLAEDPFIEFCDDWAIPYIADLVGTRLVNPLNVRGRRVDVASTIYYRRRKGTPRVLQMFPRDIAGWDGALVEAFRRLGRTPHRLDPPLAGKNAQRWGRLSGTPPGGFANLRSPRGAECVGGAFEEYSRTADFRQLRGEKGRFNIPKLNIHVFRLRPLAIEKATPFPIGPRQFTLDPSGRDIQLFACGAGDDSDVTAERLFEASGNQAQEAAKLRTGLPDWTMPLPITCRMMADMHYRLSPGSFDSSSRSAAEGLFGLEFVSEERLRRILTPLYAGDPQAASKIAEVINNSIDPQSAKYNLIADPARPKQKGFSISLAIGATTEDVPLAQAAIVPADLGAWGTAIAAPAGGKLLIDPVRARVVVLNPAAGELIDRLYVTALFGALGAGYSTGAVSAPDITFGRANAAEAVDPGPITLPALPTSGVCEWPDSRTYVLAKPPSGKIADVTELTLQAADGVRPLVRLERLDGVLEWIVSAKAIADPTKDVRTLTIDGLWFGIRNAAAVPSALPPGKSAPAPVPAVFALDGVFNRVTLRNVTLDPGGVVAPLDPTKGLAIPGIRLELRGEVEVLEIENSILGPIVEKTSATDPSSAGHIVVRNSVVQSCDPTQKALQTTLAKVTLDRCTVFGDVDVAWLDASETLIQGLVTVTDNQSGCFRFSAADEGSTTPAAFQSHFFDGGIPDHAFLSRVFGSAEFAVLSATADPALRHGAESGSEIGVWCGMIAPIRAADLSTKTREYLPFGLIPQFIIET